MATLRPLNNNIMFQFLDSTGGSKGRFTDTHRSGIILVPSVDSQKKARWGLVLSVGPKVEGVQPGDYILIEALMWMEGTKVDGVPMWKTDDTKVLAVTDDLASCTSQ